MRACYREAGRDQRHRWAKVRLVPMVGQAPDPGDALADQDELDRAFARLAPEQRALVVLHFYLGLPVHETSEILGVPVGTVKSRLHRTLRQMRAALDADARLPMAEGRWT
ncbi:MAG: RNA polymerase sigma factor [Chloroflexota bacterium]